MTASAPTAAVVTDATRQRYIASAWYDWVFFLSPPVVALGLGIALSGSRYARDEVTLFGSTGTATSIFIGTFIHAHLVAVFFRSHGNPSIVKRYPVRFFVVPLALLAVMLESPFAFVTVSVLATFWDVYHSGLQTFGFGRMYDRAAGNSPDEGRRLDYWFNLLFYAGPIVAGATMLDHFTDFFEFAAVDAMFFTKIPFFMSQNHRYFTLGVLVLGAGFSAYYVYAYWRLHRRGYRVSLLKVCLYASTALCSIYTWGFNTWGEAFFIMNFFHALQYFGLVWWAEGDRLTRRLTLDRVEWGKPLVLALFVGSTFLYGAFAELVGTGVRWWWALTLVVSLMHFWYDGFIWSVRKMQ